jgi:hypothetical protein
MNYWRLIAIDAVKNVAKNKVNYSINIRTKSVTSNELRDIH